MIDPGEERVIFFEMQFDANRYTFTHGESTATHATRFPVGEIRPTLDFALFSRSSSECFFTAGVTSAKFGLRFILHICRVSSSSESAPGVSRNAAAILDCGG